MRGSKNSWERGHSHRRGEPLPGDEHAGEHWGLVNAAGATAASQQDTRQGGHTGGHVKPRAPTCGPLVEILDTRARTPNCVEHCSVTVSVFVFSLFRNAFPLVQPCTCSSLVVVVFGSSSSALSGRHTLLRAHHKDTFLATNWPFSIIFTQFIYEQTVLNMSGHDLHTSSCACIK